MAASQPLPKRTCGISSLWPQAGTLDGLPTGNGWRSAHLIDSQSLGCKNSVRNLTGKILKRGPWRPLPKIWQVVARLECIEVSTCSVFRC
jgi:hypothetical protein